MPKADARRDVRYRRGREAARRVRRNRQGEARLRAERGTRRPPAPSGRRQFDQTGHAMRKSRAGSSAKVQPPPRRKGAVGGKRSRAAPPLGRNGYAVGGSAAQQARRARPDRQQRGRHSRPRTTSVRAPHQVSPRTVGDRSRRAPRPDRDGAHRSPPRVRRNRHRAAPTGIGLRHCRDWAGAVHSPPVPRDRDRRRARWTADRRATAARTA